jgi:V/A-type H+-transporting ATPase subunit I
MTKIMIVSHRSEATELLEALQKEGICQILNAEQAMVTKDWPELVTEAAKPKEIEERLGRLAKSIAFLKGYSKKEGGLAAALAPRAVVGEDSYNKVVSESGIFEIIERCEQTENKIEKLKGEIENIYGILKQLWPWEGLETPVEELGQLKKATCLAGLLPSQNFEKVVEEAGKFGAAVEKIGATNNSYACLVVCLNEAVNEIQKLLRSAELEHVSFSLMKGSVRQLIQEHNEKLNQTQRKLTELDKKAAVLSADLLKLEILYDHHNNLLNREYAKDTAPATERTVVLEGWVREKDYKRLEKLVLWFHASSLARIAPVEGEEIPVDIENPNIIKPFEVVTRLYGMPQYFNIDPTAFLAPFFTVFFALCLADTGYGLLMVVIAAWLTVKMQGDKKLLIMLGICGVSTAIFGALTGGWFGDIIQQFIPALEPMRHKLMLFDPLANPIPFLALALGLGYFQINVGIAIALGHDLKHGDFVSAIFNRLTWLVMLNSILIFGFGKFGLISGHIGSIFGKIAIVPAVMILLFSHREGGWGARLGMGFYNVFSTIFFLGDVLSYLRLMALGMVGGGLAMAINVLAKIAMGLPYGIGIIAMVLILVGGHLFNLAMSALGAFVHTLRLQYVEFFPKFLIGGGRNFEPLAKQYKHIYLISGESNAVSEK